MINWSEDREVLHIQTRTVIELLGFEIPQTEEQDKEWDKAFEGYPNKLGVKDLDFEKIWKNLDQ